jgi:integrase
MWAGPYAAEFDGMSRALHRLTAKAVAGKTKEGRYADGGGLWLQVRPNGKSWLFRYELNGRARAMGLGPLHTITLAEAREAATAARKLLLAGIDPLEQRRQERQDARLAAAQGLTFEECAMKYIATHEAAWRNEVHRKQWRSTLEAYAYPVIGNLSVAAIDTGLVLKILEPIWTEKPETAGRLRGRIESVLGWAKVRGYRSGENPARWRDHLDKLLPRRSKVRKVQHHPALPYRELPAFMSALREQEGVGAQALEFTILTAVRTGETIGARRSEINFAECVWTIPPERMKAGREHRVPLSDRAMEIIADMPQEKGSDYLFPGMKAKAPLSNMSLLAVLKRMGRDDLTVHGFRSTFRDWAAEMTAYPRELAEAALAHIVKDKTEAAYQRGTMLEKRRRLMADWAKFAASKPADLGNVATMRRK